MEMFSLRERIEDISSAQEAANELQTLQSAISVVCDRLNKALEEHDKGTLAEATTVIIEVIKYRDGERIRTEHFPSELNIPLLSLEDNIRQQTKGIPMGTNAGPEIANLTLYVVES
eukprot:gene17764-36376_t